MATTVFNVPAENIATKITPYNVSANSLTALKSALITLNGTLANDSGQQIYFSIPSNESYFRANAVYIGNFYRYNADYFVCNVLGVIGENITMGYGLGVWYISSPYNDITELNSNITALGTIIDCTKISPAPSIANGTSETIAEITLTKGRWLLFASGYSPIMSGNEVINQPTTIGISYENGTIANLSYCGQSLTYLFNLSTYVIVTSASVKVKLAVLNWEGVTLTASTNYQFYAVKVKDE